MRSVHVQFYKPGFWDSKFLELWWRLPRGSGPSPGMTGFSYPWTGDSDFVKNGVEVITHPKFGDLLPNVKSCSIGFLSLPA